MAKMTQRTYTEHEGSWNIPRMALLFLLDTSLSMRGEPIRELNAGLNKFKDVVCENERARCMLDVAIVRFDVEPQVVQEFTPISEMEGINLPADGTATNYAPAIDKALEMVVERARHYKKFVPPHKPWIIFVTDGAPSDNIINVAKKINDLATKGKVNFFSLGVGDYQSEPLHALSPDKVVRLKDKDFSKFFEWVGESMYAVSTSAPGDSINVPRLPENMERDLRDSGGLVG